MDNTRFDSLTKQLATGASRRGILKGLIGGAAVVAATGHTRNAAKATVECVTDNCNMFHPCCHGQCSSTDTHAGHCIQPSPEPPKKKNGNNGFGNGGPDGSPNGKQDHTR